jgi:hypothetical protein
MGVQKVFVPSTHVFSERIVYVSAHESDVEGVALIHFSPPIIIGTVTACLPLPRTPRTTRTTPLGRPAL